MVLLVKYTWEYYFLLQQKYNFTLIPIDTFTLIPIDTLKFTESPGLYCHTNGNILDRLGYKV